jgi:signal transduction histidine kinase
MLKLSISLLFSAICALFVLGAGLDLLANADTQTQPEEQHLYQTIIETIGVKVNLAQASELVTLIENEQRHWQLALALIPRNSVALPAELEQQLHLTGGLPLANEAGTLYLKALSQHPTLLLQLNVADLSAHKPEDLWLTLALYAGLCLIMLLWLTPLARRLWLLSKTANQFGAGNFKVRLPQSRWSYISSLEFSFNQMAQQIEQLMADNQLLASSLSHDLRTPIACFRFGLDAALEEENSERKNSYLRRLEQDVDRMEAMVNAFLEYASLDRQHLNSVACPVNLKILCQQSVQSCEPLAHSRQVKLQLIVASHTDPIIIGHPHWLSRCLQNLLQNACRYAKQQIAIELWQDGNDVCLRVRDDGEGINQIDAIRIFKPFVRLETQSSTMPQFGLGLAIVTKVLEWHKATITLESIAPAGASFVIRFPLNTKERQLKVN